LPCCIPPATPPHGRPGKFLRLSNSRQPAAPLRDECAAPGARNYFARFPEQDAMYVLFLNDIEPEKRVELDIAATVEAVLVG
jgi:hypothetical protein